MLAYLQEEPGSVVVRGALAAGALMSVVNYAEVLSRLAEAGQDPAAVDLRLRTQGLVGRLLELVPITADDAIAIARLRVTTRGQGLSLGDRSCLATGLRLARTVLTADRASTVVQAGVQVSLFRP